MRNLKIAAAVCLITGTLLAPVVMSADSDTDRSHPKAFIKDSAITAEIKSRLAAEHITSLSRIKVDTDKDGVVWLSGTARTQEAADKAAEIARNTKGVTEIKTDIRVKKDD
jgi:hyperosmotically inducible protein